MIKLNKCITCFTWQEYSRVYNTAIGELRRDLTRR